MGYDDQREMMSKLGLKSDSERRVGGEQIARSAELMDTLQTKSGNIIFSPLSMGHALYMLWAGGSDETRKALEESGWFGGHNGVQYAAIADFSLMTLYDESPVTSSTGVFLDKDEMPTKAFAYAAKFIDAGMFRLDFSNSDSVSTINGWCSEKTNGKIGHIIDGMNASHNVFIANALHFKDCWDGDPMSHKEHVRDMEFSNADGSKKDCVCWQSAEEWHMENDYAEATLREFGSGTYSFMVVLPKEHGDFKLSDLHIDELLDPEKSFWHPNAITFLSVPEFKSGGDYKVSEALRKSGLGLLFAEGAEPRMLESNVLEYVDEIAQRAVIEVDRNGAEAAAVTYFPMFGSCGGDDERPTEFVMTCDRPFAYAIVNMNTRQVLFLGKVADMNEAFKPYNGESVLATAKEKYPDTDWDEIMSKYGIDEISEMLTNRF